MAAVVAGLAALLRTGPARRAPRSRVRRRAACSSSPYPGSPGRARPTPTSKRSTSCSSPAPPIADLAPRSVVSRSGPGDAYLTISAGYPRRDRRAGGGPGPGGPTRATSSPPAGEVFVRRTGVEPDGEYVALGWPELVRRQRRPALRRRARPAGRDARRRGGRDGGRGQRRRQRLQSSRPIQRQAGLALAGTDGVLAVGRPRHRPADPPIRREPFGFRLDHDAVRRRRSARTWDAAAGGRAAGGAWSRPPTWPAPSATGRSSTRSATPSCGPTHWPTPTPCSASSWTEVDLERDCGAGARPLRRDGRQRPHRRRAVPTGASSRATCARPRPSGPAS